MSGVSPSTIERWLKGWRFVAVVAIAVGVLGVLFLWLGPGPTVPRQRLTWAREEDGPLEPVGETSPPAHFAARAEVTETKSSLSTTTASSSSGSARFACQTIVILNESDHPLIARSALQMIEPLKKLSYVDRIDYLPRGEKLETGRLAPDVCIRLSLHKIDESNLLVRRSVDAQVVAHASSSWVSSRHHHHDRLTPPRLNFQWTGRLQHQSKSRGVASSAARYTEAAKSIGKELGKSLVKQFDKFREEYGPMPDLPADFYPPYREPQPLQFLKRYDTHLLSSWHGLMNHNETFWEMEVPGHAGDNISQIAREMESAGWKASSRGNERSPYARFTKEDVVVEVFPKDTDPSFPGPVVATTPPEHEGGPRRSVLYVQYVDHVSREELARAVDKILTEGTPIQVLLTFRTTWSREQRQRALEILEERNPSEPEAWVTLAELYGDEQKERARNAVLRAHVLTRTVKEPGDVTGRIKRQAKKLGIEDIADETVPESMLRELGFIEVRPGLKPVETKVGVSEPATFFMRTDKGLVTTTARVVRKSLPEGKASYVLQLVSERGGARSWSEGGTVRENSPVARGSSYGDDRRCEVVVNKISGKERFRVTAKVR